MISWKVGDADCETAFVILKPCEMLNALKG